MILSSQMNTNLKLFKASSLPSDMYFVSNFHKKVKIREKIWSKFSDYLKVAYQFSMSFLQILVEVA